MAEAIDIPILTASRITREEIKVMEMRDTEVMKTVDMEMKGVATADQKTGVAMNLMVEDLAITGIREVDTEEMKAVILEEKIKVAGSVREIRAAEGKENIRVVVMEEKMSGAA